MAGAGSYEDRFDPVSRRVHRLSRAIRWNTKRTLRRPPHVLIEIRWRLGDETMAIPIYEGIKRRFPFCSLTVWCNYPELLTRNPYVDHAIGGDASPPGPSQIDRYLHLRGAPRNIFRLEHYAQRAGIPVPTSNPRLYLEDWNCPLLHEIGDDFVAVSSGASWPTKRWPIDHWRSLCRLLESGGYHIVQLGKDDERIGVGVDFVDRTSVRDAASILRAAKVFICGDSGLMHLALAVGTPVVALFGPTDPSILIRESPAFTALTNGRDCRGCWNGAQRMVTEGVCPLNIESCMESLSVGDVRRHVETRLGTKA